MFKKAVLAMSLCMIATTAFAADRDIEVQMREGQTASLGPCGGTATVRREEGTLKVFISNTRDCSNIKINGKEIGKLKNGAGTETIELNEHIGSNNFQVEAVSNKGKTSVRIDINSYLQPVRREQTYNVYSPADFSLSTGIFGRKEASLQDCGGQVYLTGSGNSTTLNFSGIQNCSNFDVMTSDGRSVLYPNTKIGRGNSSLPLIAGQGSSLKVIVKSDTSKHYDIFVVNYLSVF